MKLNPIQHRMMINRGLAYVAFKCQKAGHKWASAMSAMRCAFTDLTTPRLVKASGLIVSKELIRKNCLGINLKK